MKTATHRSPPSLSAEEVALCQLFGTSPEDYAAQKAALAMEEAQASTGPDLQTLANLAVQFGNTYEDVKKYGG